ncbi:MAG: hypothetical protein H8E78_04130 [Proteobacteria bacterium]|nr:hypothetical protein [Pseudomonadota bacterium]
MTSMAPDLLRQLLSTIVMSLMATVLICLFSTSAAVAFDRDDERTFNRPSRSSYRETGLAYVDLPLRLRARFEIAYTDDVYQSDALARPYVTVSGPSLRDDESLESQFALTRSLTDKVEIGIVWRAWSSITHVDLFDFERQTVGAMIRIVP